MRIYIPATYRAALMTLKRGNAADMAREKAISQQHRYITARLFEGLTQGSITEAHQRTPHSLTIYHRSTRPDILIQCSHFYRTATDSAFYAVSHHDINSPKDFNLSPGRYITITEEA